MKKLIVFSGIDSAGKSTQIELLKKHLYEKNIRFKVIWSRGGYTSIFEFLKNAIRMVFGKKLPDPGRNASRQNMFEKKSVSKIWYILGMLDLIRLYFFSFRLYRLFGYTIIADRYLWDTYVDFKISLKNIDIEKSFLWKLAVKLSPKPYKSILLYISPETSFQRSILKDEPHFDSLEIRSKRIGIYDTLISLQKWGYVVNTEKVGEIQTQGLLRDYIDGI